MNPPKNITAIQSNRAQDLFYVHWNIGRRCNYDCSYCADSLHDFKSPHRSLSNLIEIASKMKLNIPDEKRIRIWFTGGEPTVNPNFLEFCKWLSNDDRFLVGLNTNGSRTTAYLLELMQYINIMQFSSHFEYVEEQTFLPKIKAVNEFAETKNSKSMSLNLMMEPEYWNKAVRMVKYCIENKIPYHIKRIRPKSVVYEGRNRYAPAYSDDQIRFLTDNEYRNVILEEYDE